jgi:hypothetical protein
MAFRWTAAGLALAAVLLAGGPAPAGKVQGTIVFVDRVSERVRVAQPGGKEYVFPRGPNTAVTLDGERHPFDQLQTGWRVAVQFDDRTGVAARIDAAHR